MHGSDSRIIACPYCGESFEAIIDPSVTHQNYIEDCEICCRPIIFDVQVEPDGAIELRVSHEND